MGASATGRHDSAGPVSRLPSEDGCRASAEPRRRDLGGIQADAEAWRPTEKVDGSSLTTWRTADGVLHIAGRNWELDPTTCNVYWAAAAAAKLPIGRVSAVTSILASVMDGVSQRVRATFSGSALFLACGLSPHFDVLLGAVGPGHGRVEISDMLRRRVKFSVKS